MHRANGVKLAPAPLLPARLPGREEGGRHHRMTSASAPPTTCSCPEELLFLGRTCRLSPPINEEDRHWEIMAEFLALYGPAYAMEIRHCISVNTTHGFPQRFRARITTRRAWADLIYNDTTPQDRAEWMDSMPTPFAELTDDYAMAALMMWTWTDLCTARVFKLMSPDPAARVFDDNWLRLHFPAQKISMISATEKAWLCPHICATCRLARLSCPECRMKTREWLAPPSGGRMEARSDVKDFPPCGSVPYLLPYQRESFCRNWLRTVSDRIDAQLAAEGDAAGAP
jgi:hypothetical protein